MESSRRLHAHNNEGTAIEEVVGRARSSSQINPLYIPADLLTPTTDPIAAAAAAVPALPPSALAGTPVAATVMTAATTTTPPVRTSAARRSPAVPLLPHLLSHLQQQTQQTQMQQQTQQTQHQPAEEEGHDSDSDSTYGHYLAQCQLEEEGIGSRPQRQEGRQAAGVMSQLGPVVQIELGQMDDASALPSDCEEDPEEGADAPLAAQVTVAAVAAQQRRQQQQQ